MAQITLTIPDEHVQRVIDALCLGTANPVPATPANAKDVVIQWVKDHVLEYEMEMARRAAITDVSTLVT
jgi:hypothetical protein